MLKCRGGDHQVTEREHIAPCGFLAFDLAHKPPGLLSERTHRNQADEFLDKQAARPGGCRHPSTEDSVYQFRDRYRGIAKGRAARERGECFR